MRQATAAQLSSSNPARVLPHRLGCHHLRSPSSNLHSYSQAGLRGLIFFLGMRNTSSVQNPTKGWLGSSSVFSFLFASLVTKVSIFCHLNPRGDLTVSSNPQQWQSNASARGFSTFQVVPAFPRQNIFWIFRSITGWVQIFQGDWLLQRSGFSWRLQSRQLGRPHDSRSQWAVVENWSQCVGFDLEYTRSLISKKSFCV